MAADYKKMEAIVQHVDKLPTLSSIVTKLNSLLSNPQTSIKEVTAVLSEDQAMTAKILRLANSSFYGFPGQVGTITQAIVLLGFTAGADVALSASVLDTFVGLDAADANFKVSEFWEHSIGVACMSKLIARRKNFPEPEEFFVTGLIHDIGKLVMLQYTEPEFRKTLQIAHDRRCSFLEAEDEIDFSHALLGRFLAQTWNLPQQMTESVGFHHVVRATRPSAALAAAVHFADIFTIARGVGNSGSPRLPPLCRPAWDLLEIPTGDFVTLISEYDAEMMKAQVFVDLAKGKI